MLREMLINTGSSTVHRVGASNVSLPRWRSHDGCVCVSHLGTAAGSLVAMTDLGPEASGIANGFALPQASRRLFPKQDVSGITDVQY